MSSGPRSLPGAPLFCWPRGRPKSQHLGRAATNLDGGRLSLLLLPPPPPPSIGRDWRTGSPPTGYLLTSSEWALALARRKLHFFAAFRKRRIVFGCAGPGAGPRFWWHAQRRDMRAIKIIFSRYKSRVPAAAARAGSRFIGPVPRGARRRNEPPLARPRAERRAPATRGMRPRSPLNHAESDCARRSHGAGRRPAPAP